MFVFGHDVHPVEKDSLDRVLPRPERQGIIAERTIIRVQHQCGKAIRRYGDRH
jgi:hypothetical protein